MSEDLTLEKMRISERLAKVEVNQENIGKKVDEIHCALMGNNGNLGLLKIVDRHDQIIKSWKDSIKLVWISIIGLATKAFWGLFDK